jgi:hypothetical protein
MPKEIIIRGSDQEINTFTEVQSHYSLSRADLEQRIYRKNGFDDADKMFASHIDEKSWPYRSLIFDPIPYTTILEKTARLIGGKPKGRLVPRENGDTVGAYINNELLSYQWEDNSRLGQSMIAKWMMMDQNTRKYGSSFAIVPWRWEQRVRKDGDKVKKETFYDGPDFIVCNNRDVLANPAYEFINKWFQHREYTTLNDLERINDSARVEPKYKNLKELAEAIREDGKGKGDKRDIQSKNKSMRGLDDYIGRDEYNKTIEIITEYRPDRWITIAPKHGVVLRDIPNPYKHGEIPVVHLKYYPLPDDLYGVGELEPVSKQIKAINAHDSAFSDILALGSRPPIHVNPLNVRMHTLSWDPEAKWLMQNPNQDVQVMRMDQLSAITNNYTSIKTMLRSSLLNALGESSQGVSQINPTQDDGRVTATEVRDTAFTRNVRDNMNKIFLSEALKKQIMFWHSMNQQFMFKATKDKLKIIRIVGREAVDFFNGSGLSDVRPTQQDAADAEMAMMNGMPPPEVVPGPRYAVNLGPDDSGMPLEVPKFMPDENGQGGNLIIEPSDLNGNYDYMPDIESMSAPQPEQLEQKLNTLLTMVTNPTIIQLLMQEGTKPKVKEILVKAIESTNVVKDADSYFEDLKGGAYVQNPTNQGGVDPSTGGVPPEGAVPTGGMGPSGAPPSGAVNQVGSGGPPAI